MALEPFKPKVPKPAAPAPDGNGATASPKIPVTRPVQRRSPAGLWISLGILLLGAVVVVYYFYFLQKPAATTSSGGGHPHSGASDSIRVVTAKATKGNIGVYLTGLGAVTPLNTDTIQSRVSGQLMKVLFTDGQMVKEGDHLLQIDDRPYKAQLAQYVAQKEHDQALLDNAQIDLLRLRIPVPESLAGKVRIGDSADVHVQATGEHFTGKVARYTDALDTSTRTMQVEIDVPNPNYHLQPGMYADVQLSADSRPNTLTVPIEAIRRGDNKSTVLVLDANNRVQSREVQLGVESSDSVEIVAGLMEGERVIVGNLGSYQPGELVRPKAGVFDSGPGNKGTE